MTDSVRFVTGASDGFGKYVATKLAGLGGTLLLHGRQADKLERVVMELRQQYPATSIETYIADFADLEQVANLVATMTEKHTKVDLLINNAGIGFGPPGGKRELGVQGYELRFTVNYLAPYLFTIKLQPLLQAALKARVVNVASLGQSPLDFNDLQLVHGYSGTRAYGQSKLALIMATFDWAEEWQPDNIFVNALHPATYAATHMVEEAGIAPISTIAEGGEAILRLATDSSDRAGIFFNEFTPAQANAQAYDLQVRKQLRAVTHDLLQPWQQ